MGLLPFAIFYVVVSIAAGIALVATTPRRSHVQLFVIGNVALASLFAALTVAGQQRLFRGAAIALAIIGIVRGRRELLQRWTSATRTTIVRQAVAFAFIAVLAARAAWFVDRLPLGEANPRGFAWLDTPLWLTLGYGAERGIPLPDLLFSGARVSYHVGAFILLAAVRRLTGLPMHAAYFVMLATQATALCLVLRDAFVRWFGVRSFHAQIAVMLIGAAWLEALIFNLSTMVAVTLAIVVLSELAVVRRVVSTRAAVVVVGLTALAFVKEVQWSQTVLIAAFVAGAQVHLRRAPAAVLATGSVFGAIVPPRLLPPTERVTLTIHHAHLEGPALSDELARDAAWFALGAIALVFVLGVRPRAREHVVALLAGIACYVAGVLIWLGVLPVITPPRSPTSMLWLLRDMGQFSIFGKQVMFVAIVLAGLALWVRRSRPGHRVQLAAVGVLTFNALFSVWRAKPQGYEREHPEERGSDPVFAVLSQVDPAKSLIAAEHLNWNEENPHWAAFFGHRFFVLRTNRWVTAAPHFARQLAEQRVLFDGSDEERARAVITERGITHLIEEKSRPVPWLTGKPCAFETPEYCLHAFEP